MALPTLTVLAIRKLARRLAGVSSSDYPDSDVLADMNDGYAELAVLLANLDEDYFEEQNTTFSLVARSSLYSLPEDCLAVKRISLAYSGTPVARSAYTIATPYDSSEVHDVGFDEENVPVSNPIYDLTAQYVRYKPTPASDVTNGGLMDYIAMPSALVNTGDIPVIPIGYQKKLAVYCAEKMTFKFEKWNKHSRLEKQWNTTMAELQDRLAERDRNRPLRFKAPGEVSQARRQRVREM